MTPIAKAKVPLTSDPGGEMRRMHDRDMQRHREAEATRKRVLAAFPDAPPALATLMAEERWLAEWLARQIGNGE